MYSSSSQYPTDAEPLLYRNGFLLADAKLSEGFLEAWQRFNIGTCASVVHPETPVYETLSDGVRGFLLGMAFDPELGVFEESALLDSLASIYLERDKFLSGLDRLSGRFLLIFEVGGTFEVFQDAMGSRSAFYSPAGTAVVASHSEIVAKLAGVGFADFIIPFLTSKNFVQKDVKYLPGLATSYDTVRQLTPNTSITFPQQEVRRFWPRSDSFLSADAQTMTDMLDAHLSGLGAYLRLSRKKAAVGLTAGSDSRGVFAAVCTDEPYVFTYVRSPDGSWTASEDSRKAEEIASAYGLRVHVLPIMNRLSLNDASTSFGYAFRRSTGYYRGASSAWIDALSSQKVVHNSLVLIRGFGGEILRGFYQHNSKNIRRINPVQLADTYDINAGSNITRNLFEEMIQITNFSKNSIYGFDPNDIFYWEHRMGTWGSLSMSEADLALPSMVGYNSRNLYSGFMSMSIEDRGTRSAFDQVVMRQAPKLSFLYDK